MNTLEKYRKECRSFFFASVDKDLTKWTGSFDFFSPDYNNCGFRTDRRDFVSYLKVYSNGSDEKICCYRWLFIPLDFKVYRYAKKLKQHYKQKLKDKENEKNIKTLKSGLENIKVEFIKEVRKEKLKKINKVLNDQ